MIIKNGFVFQDQGAFLKGDLFLNKDLIAASAGGDVLDAEGLYVIPGLIDIHFHGCDGYDFCDGTPEALQAIAGYELQQGIMAICPASMTFSEEQLSVIFENAASFNSHSGAELVGIHMEGPFISMEKKGAQNGACIRKPDPAMFLRLQKKANGLIRLVDIAPEKEGALDFIEAVRDRVQVSLAHTNADYDTACAAFQCGASHVTHLYNAMPPFSHRAPGVVGAACDSPSVMTELICDGIHVHPATVRATFQLLSDDRIILISDSMRACGLADGEYTLGGQVVTVTGNRAVLKENSTLAGSVTHLMNCLRIAVKQMQIPLASAVKCATVNPARAIGIYDTFGSTQIGKKANLLLLDEQLNICRMIKNGVLIY